MRVIEVLTGFDASSLEQAGDQYEDIDLDQVAPFYDEGTDAVVVSAIFAARVSCRSRTSSGPTSSRSSRASTRCSMRAASSSPSSICAAALRVTPALEGLTLTIAPAE